jgi:hypothetical protein
MPVHLAHPRWEGSGISALFDVSAPVVCPSNGFGDTLNKVVVRVPLHLAHPRWNGFEISAFFDVSTVVV